MAAQYQVRLATLLILLAVPLGSLANPLAGQRASDNESDRYSSEGQYAQQPTSGARNVVFNGKRLDANLLGQLEQAAGQIPNGRYWYDRYSGMVGQQGGPTVAYFYAGIDFCPPLSANASGGGTPVMVNGRYLHPTDLAGLRAFLGPISPGRYWLDAQGNYGYEGQPAIGNLLTRISVAQQGGGYGGGGGSVYRHFPNLGPGGSGVSVGGDIVNAGGVLWWPGK